MEVGFQNLYIHSMPSLKHSSLPVYYGSNDNLPITSPGSCVPFPSYCLALGHDNN